MRLAGIETESIVDGPGIRFAVFFQGCNHHCKGCHNPGTWDMAGGQEVTLKRVLELLDEADLVSGVTLTGGDPLYQIESALELAREVKNRKLHLIIYTGYLYEELMEMAHKDEQLDALLALTDVLIDGPFVLQERDLSLRFRGSSNQRCINVAQSRKTGKIVVDQY
ncbi:MAG TPA: anaerobic ribonucleoside-triphosphate reductase activating protein [Bacilli bacterium]|nr:anaerobic ribonucleoside-triphosphate reductase activating protein [Bacilli bacterium]